MASERVTQQQPESAVDSRGGRVSARHRGGYPSGHNLAARRVEGTTRWPNPAATACVCDHTGSEVVDHGSRDDGGASPQGSGFRAGHSEPGGTDDSGQRQEHHEGDCGSLVRNQDPSNGKSEHHHASSSDRDRQGVVRRSPHRQASNGRLTIHEVCHDRHPPHEFTHQPGREFGQGNLIEGHDAKEGRCEQDRLEHLHGFGKGHQVGRAHRTLGEEDGREGASHQVGDQEIGQQTVDAAACRRSRGGGAPGGRLDHGRACHRIAMDRGGGHRPAQ